MWQIHAQLFPYSSIWHWIFFSHKHPPTQALTSTFAVSAFVWWLRAWLAFPPVTTPLSLSAKGGEGSSPMPKGRVPPTVCRGRGGWAGFVTPPSHLWGHVFVSPLPVSLAVVGVTVELCSAMRFTLNWNPVWSRQSLVFKRQCAWFLLKDLCGHTWFISIFSSSHCLQLSCLQCYALFILGWISR